jgi:(S)-2-hydroxyglutarate dehydrogenase
VGTSLGLYATEKDLACQALIYSAVTSGAQIPIWGRGIPISTHVEVAIIGGGIVGLATGLELTRRFPGISLAVIEKEASVAAHQTGHNSGVIHSGIYYKPGSLKARLCVDGAAALIRFCQEHKVDYNICGKLIVATQKEEIPRIEELYKRGVENGIRGLTRISSEQIREFEPYAVGIQGIHVPSTGIVDFAKVAKKYAELIISRGGQVLLSHEVTHLKRSDSETIIETTQGDIFAKLIINCAGLQSDRISGMANAKLDLRIVPFRGDYYEIVANKTHFVRGLVYPVPDPRFPFLGVHFTRHIGGGVEAGPNAVLALKREGYSKKAFDLRDMMELAMFPGFWTMAAKYWQTSLGEYYRSWSKTAFVKALQRLVPDITAEDLVPGGSGVRAQALDIHGNLVDDFRFVHAQGMIHVCNVPSPAATASLAIGSYIVDTAVQSAENKLFF